MQAGRELDRAIAERVMGWADFWEGDGYVMGYPPNEQAAGINGERAPIPHYSTDIGAAWLVWQAVKALDRHKMARFWSALRSLVQMRLDSKNLINDAHACLHMEPEDICKAMLEAHGQRMLPDWYYE